ncbi:hypothetical protein T03_7739 [Trichinella britovi]|uniref:Uncharacterized protein n=1 Tax=Trichinella britovi TaxID=45882 RepID=A0A0V1CR37_TRIBR|nr:hypothetical protein T03_7739 [Trichinella britovi]
MLVEHAHILLSQILELPADMFDTALRIVVQHKIFQFRFSATLLSSCFNLCSSKVLDIKLKIKWYFVFIEKLANLLCLIDIKIDLVDIKA